MVVCDYEQQLIGAISPIADRRLPLTDYRSLLHPVSLSPCHLFTLSPLHPPPPRLDVAYRRLQVQALVHSAKSPKQHRSRVDPPRAMLCREPEPLLRASQAVVSIPVPRTAVWQTGLR